MIDEGIMPDNRESWESRPPAVGALQDKLNCYANNPSHPQRRIASSVASHISTIFVFNTFRDDGLAFDWDEILQCEGRVFVVQLKGQGSEVSGAMMRFSVSYTKAMNKRYDRVGSVFQGAFQAKRIDSDAYLVQVSRYVHQNPVLAGYGAAPEEWEFSSYPEYIGLREGTLPNPEIVLSQFVSRDAYREYVESSASADQQAVRHLLFD